MRASLYTGKARSYLIKQGIEYLEIVPGSRRFLTEILPKIGRMIIPTIETPDSAICWRSGRAAGWSAQTTARCCEPLQLDAAGCAMIRQETARRSACDAGAQDHTQEDH